MSPGGTRMGVPALRPLEASGKFPNAPLSRGWRRPRHSGKSVFKNGIDRVKYLFGGAADLSVRPRLEGSCI